MRQRRVCAAFLRVTCSRIGYGIIALALVVVGLIGTASLEAQSPSEAVWVKETIAAGLDSHTIHTAIAVDAAGAGGTAGTVHVIYYDGSDEALKYAKQTPQGWSIETVQTYLGTPPATGDPSLRLDSSGYPHCTYLANDVLRYAYRDAERWHLETVDATMHGFSGYTSLCLSGQNVPHVSYMQESTNNSIVRYAVRGASGWQIQNVDATLSTDAGAHTSLALDTTGKPHISYCDNKGDPGGFDRIKYAYKPASSWQIQTLSNVAGADYMVGQYTSLALDSQNRPHIAYYHRQNDHPRYATKAGGAWHDEDIDASGGYYISLALDADGYPHAGYGGGGGVRYTYADAAGWHIEVVDQSVGWYTNLALDAQGQPRMVYVQPVGNIRNLIYAYRTAGPPTATPTATATPTLTPGAHANYLPVLFKPGAPPTATATPTPTLVPGTATPTATATPEAVHPQAGAWYRVSGGSVSFTVTEDGRVGSASGSTECGSEYYGGYVTIAADGSWMMDGGDYFFSGKFTDDHTCTGQTFHWDGVWGHCIGREDWVAAP